MIRDHIHHIHHKIDDQPVLIRIGITIGALLSLPLLGTAVRTLGSALSLGWATVPLLALAHVPAVVALVAIWSVGCEVCRGR